MTAFYKRYGLQPRGGLFCFRCMYPPPHMWVNPTSVAFTPM